MTPADLTALSPLIVVAATAVVVMLVVAFHRNHVAAAGVTLLGLALAFAMLPIAAVEIPRRLPPLLVMDSYALFYMGLIFAASFVVTVMAYGYLEGREGNHEEFYILELLATLGAVVLVASNHFVSLFLGLELLSVALYVLIAYLRTAHRPLEAGIKYLILAAASSAFLLFGVALVYVETGTMEFGRLAALAAAGGEVRNGFLLLGLAMITTGIGFKLAVVPFHMWTPDVYEGAPAPVTAFVATVSKGAVFALLLRYFVQVDPYAHVSLWLVFSVIAVSSMFIGNFLALMQDNVKRILAYSSIAHLGYVLVAFLASGATAVEAVAYYLVAYFVTTLGAFGVVTVLSDRRRDSDAMEDYRGLFWSRPWVAVIFTAMLLSLAGIPLTAGFLGKFYVLAAGVESSLWVLVLTLVINSAIGLFYYLRIVVAMFSPPGEQIPEGAPTLSVGGSLALVVLTFLLVWLGVYPGPLMRIIQSTVGSLV